MRRLIVAALGLFLLSGCASAPTSVSEADRSAIKTIAVQSFFGDNIRYEYVGSTVFTNKVATLSVDWNLNGYIRDKLVSELRGRYEIKPALSGYDKGGEGDAIDQAIATLRAAHQPGYVDAYVIVTYSMSNDQISHSNQYLFGMGLYAKGRMFLDPAAAAYTDYYVTVVDGRTFKSLAEVPAGVPADISYNPISAAIGSYRIPFRMLSSSMAVDDINALTPQQRETLRQALVGLIDEALPLALQRIHLLDAQTAAKPQKPSGPHLLRAVTVADVTRIRSAGLSTICRPRRPPLTTISSSVLALASTKVRRRLRAPSGLMPPTT